MTDAPSAQRWIGDLLSLVVARFEAPLWLRAFDAGAAAAAGAAAFATCNGMLLAARETAELRAESEQMGASLCRLMPAFGLVPPAPGPIAYPAAFAAACVGLAVPRETGLAAYLWAWAENQVLVAVKTVPLGQQAGQRLLFALHERVLQAVQVATRIAATDGDEHLGTAAVGLALMSARHERQYSRLFRS